MSQPSPVRQPVAMRTGGGLGAFLRKVWAVALKDLQAELRGREVIVTMVAFAALAILIYAMAFDVRVPQAAMVAPGVLWGVILYTGILGLNRAFGAEVDRGTLAALLMAPVDRSALYYGKVLANLLFTGATAAVILLLMVVFFNLNLFQPLIVAGVGLGILGYVAVGTVFAALTANARARESMLPILLLPIMMPIFVAGVGLTASVVDGKGFADVQAWLGILVAYDLIFLLVAFLVFDLIWEDS